MDLFQLKDRKAFVPGGYGGIGEGKLPICPVL
jgi:hypothetical protein